MGNSSSQLTVEDVLRHLHQPDWISAKYRQSILGTQQPLRFSYSANNPLPPENKSAADQDRAIEEVIRAACDELIKLWDEECEPLQVEQQIHLLSASSSRESMSSSSRSEKEREREKDRENSRRTIMTESQQISKLSSKYRIKSKERGSSLPPGPLGMNPVFGANNPFNLLSVRSGANPEVLSLVQALGLRDRDVAALQRSMGVEEETSDTEDGDGDGVPSEGSKEQPSSSAPNSARSGGVSSIHYRILLLPFIWSSRDENPSLLRGLSSHPVVRKLLKIDSLSSLPSCLEACSEAERKVLEELFIVDPSSDDTPPSSASSQPSSSTAPSSLSPPSPSPSPPPSSTSSSSSSSSSLAPVPSSLPIPLPPSSSSSSSSSSSPFSFPFPPLPSSSPSPSPSPLASSSSSSSSSSGGASLSSSDASLPLPLPASFSSSSSSSYPAPAPSPCLSSPSSSPNSSPSFSPSSSPVPPLFAPNPLPRSRLLQNAPSLSSPSLFPFPPDGLPSVSSAPSLALFPDDSPSPSPPPDSSSPFSSSSSSPYSSSISSSCSPFPPLPPGSFPHPAVSPPPSSILPPDPSEVETFDFLECFTEFAAFCLTQKDLSSSLLLIHILTFYRQRGTFERVVKSNCGIRSTVSCLKKVVSPLKEWENISVIHGEAKKKRSEKQKPEVSGVQSEMIANLVSVCGQSEGACRIALEKHQWDPNLAMCWLLDNGDLCEEKVEEEKAEEEDSRSSFDSMVARSEMKSSKMFSELFRSVESSFLKEGGAQKKVEGEVELRELLNSFVDHLPLILYSHIDRLLIEISVDPPPKGLLFDPKPVLRWFSMHGFPITFSLLVSCGFEKATRLQEEVSSNGSLNPKHLYPLSILFRCILRFVVSNRGLAEMLDHTPAERLSIQKLGELIATFCETCGDACPHIFPEHVESLREKGDTIRLRRYLRSSSGVISDAPFDFSSGMKEPAEHLTHTQESIDICFDLWMLGFNLFYPTLPLRVNTMSEWIEKDLTRKDLSYGTRALLIISLSISRSDPEWLPNFRNKKGKQEAEKVEKAWGRSDFCQKFLKSGEDILDQHIFSPNMEQQLPVLPLRIIADLAHNTLSTLDTLSDILDDSAENQGPDESRWACFPQYIDTLRHVLFHALCHSYNQHKLKASSNSDSFDLFLIFYYLLTSSLRVLQRTSEMVKSHGTRAFSEAVSVLRDSIVCGLLPDACLGFCVLPHLDAECAQVLLVRVDQALRVVSTLASDIPAVKVGTEGAIKVQQLVGYLNPLKRQLSFLLGKLASMLISGSALADETRPIHVAARASDANAHGTIQYWTSSPLLCRGKTDYGLSQIGDEKEEHHVQAPHKSVQSEGENSGGDQDSEDDDMSEDGETSASDIGSVMRDEDLPRYEKKKILEHIMEGKDSYSPLWLWVKEHVASGPRRKSFLRRVIDEESERYVDNLERCLFAVVLLHLNVVEDAYDFVTNSKARERASKAMKIKVPEGHPENFQSCLKEIIHSWDLFDGLLSHITQMHRGSPKDPKFSYQSICSGFIEKAKFLCSFQPSQPLRIGPEKSATNSSPVRSILSLAVQFVKSSVSVEEVNDAIAQKQKWIEMKIFGWTAIGKTLDYCSGVDSLQHLLLWVRPCGSFADKTPSNFMFGCIGAPKALQDRLRNVWEGCFRSLLKLLSSPNFSVRRYVLDCLAIRINDTDSEEREKDISFLYREGVMGILKKILRRGKPGDTMDSVAMTGAMSHLSDLETIERCQNRYESMKRQYVEAEESTTCHPKCFAAQVFHLLAVQFAINRPSLEESHKVSVYETSTVTLILEELQRCLASFPKIFPHFGNALTEKKPTSPQNSPPRDTEPCNYQQLLGDIESFSGKCAGRVVTRLIKSTDAKFPTNFSISLWVRPSRRSPPSSRLILFRGDVRTTSELSFLLNYNTNNKQTIGFWVNTKVGVEKLESKTKIPAGQWSHIACTCRRQRAMIYINGKFDSERLLGSYASFLKEHNRVHIVRCFTAFPNGISGGFQGDLYDISYHTRSLSQPVIESLALCTPRMSFPPLIYTKGLLSDLLLIFQSRQSHLQKLEPMILQEESPQRKEFSSLRFEDFFVQYEQSPSESVDLFLRLLLTTASPSIQVAVLRIFEAIFPFISKKNVDAETLAQQLSRKRKRDAEELFWGQVNEDDNSSVLGDGIKSDLGTLLGNLPSHNLPFWLVQFLMRVLQTIVGAQETKWRSREYSDFGFSRLVLSAELTTFLQKYLVAPKTGLYLQSSMDRENFSCVVPFLEKFLILNSSIVGSVSSSSSNPSSSTSITEDEQTEAMNRVDALLSGLYLCGGGRDVLRVGSNVAIVSSKDKSALKTSEGPCTLSGFPHSLPYCGSSSTVAFSVGGQIPWQPLSSTLVDSFQVEKNVGVITSLCPFWPVADVSIQDRLKVCPLKNLQSPSDFYSNSETFCFPLPPSLFEMFGELFKLPMSFCFPLSSFHCVQEVLMMSAHLRSTAMRVCMTQTACSTATARLISSPVFSDILRIASIPATLARRYGDGSLEALERASDKAWAYFYDMKRERKARCCRCCRMVDDQPGNGPTSESCSGKEKDSEGSGSPKQEEEKRREHCPCCRSNSVQNAVILREEKKASKREESVKQLMRLSNHPSGVCQKALSKCHWSVSDAYHYLLASNKKIGNTSANSRFSNNSDDDEDPTNIMACITELSTSQCQKALRQNDYRIDEAIKWCLQEGKEKIQVKSKSKRKSDLPDLKEEAAEPRDALLEEENESFFATEVFRRVPPSSDSSDLGSSALYHLLGSSGFSGRLFPKSSASRDVTKPEKNEKRHAKRLNSLSYLGVLVRIMELENALCIYYARMCMVEILTNHFPAPSPLLPLFSQFKFGGKWGSPEELVELFSAPSVLVDFLRLNLFRSPPPIHLHRHHNPEMCPSCDSCFAGGKTSTDAPSDSHRSTKALSPSQFSLISVLHHIFWGKITKENGNNIASPASREVADLLIDKFLADFEMASSSPLYQLTAWGHRAISENDFQVLLHPNIEAMTLVMQVIVEPVLRGSSPYELPSARLEKKPKYLLSSIMSEARLSSVYAALLQTTRADNMLTKKIGFDLLSLFFQCPELVPVACASSFDLPSFADKIKRASVYRFKREVACSFPHTSYAQSLSELALKLQAFVSSNGLISQKEDSKQREEGGDVEMEVEESQEVSSSSSGTSSSSSSSPPSSPSPSSPSLTPTPPLFEDKGKESEETPPSPNDKLAPEHQVWGNMDPIRFVTSMTSSEKLRFSPDGRNVQLNEAGGSDQWNFCAANRAIRSGTHYWEVRVNHTQWGSTCFGVMHIPPRGEADGLAGSLDHPQSTSNMGVLDSLGANRGRLIQLSEKFLFVNFRVTLHDNTERFYGEHIQTGDVVGVFVDADEGTISFFQNGKAMGIAFRGVPTNGFLIPIFGMKSKNDSLILLPCYSSILSVPPEVRIDNHALSVSILKSLGDKNAKPLPENFLDFAYREYQSWVKRERKKHTIRTGQKVVMDIRASSLEAFGGHDQVALGDEVFTHNGKAKVVGVFGGHLWLSRKNIAWHYPMWTNRSPAPQTKPPPQYSCLSREEFEANATDSFWLNPHNNIYLKEIVHNCNQKSEVYNIEPEELIESLRTSVGETSSKLSMSPLSEWVHEKLMARFCLLLALQELLRYSLPLISYEALVKDDLLRQGMKQFTFFETKFGFYEKVLRKTATAVIHPEDEYEDPKRFPVLNIKRQVAYAAKDVTLTDEHQRISLTIFGQLYRGLRNVSSSSLRQEWCRMLDVGQVRAFRVNFSGEGSDDYGGPYREVFSHVCEELESDLLPLLIPIPNKRYEAGENRDCFTFDPRRKDEDLKYYRFLGQLMGIALRCGITLSLRLPSFFWKFILGEPFDRNDVLDFDSQMYRTVESILACTEDEYSSYELFWRTLNSADEEIELIPGGRTIPVSYGEREEYVERLVHARMAESIKQMAAVKAGLGVIIPLGPLHCFTWRELEERVVGRPDINIDLLIKHTVYDPKVNPEAPYIKYFWSVLRRFTPGLRCRFLQFVASRTRLPVVGGDWVMPFKILPSCANGDQDRVAPLSQTCFFSLSLPEYSSEEIMYKKLEYAIINCVEMDADHSAEYHVWGE